MSQGEYDDLSTPLFGPVNPSPGKANEKKRDTNQHSSDSNSDSSSSSEESGSDTGSGSASSSSNKSEKSAKSNKSEKSEKSISLAKTGSDASNSDDSNSNDENDKENADADNDDTKQEDDEEEEKPSSVPRNEDTDSQDTHSGGRSVGRKSNILELKQEWSQRPDLYGIRRSERSRKEVVRYVPQQRSSGSDGDGGRRHRRGRRKDSEDWGGSNSDDDSEEEEEEDSASEEDFRPARSTRTTRSRAAKPPAKSSKQRSRRGRPAPKVRGRQRRLSSSGTSDSDDSDDKRSSSRRQTASKVSYKEDSDDVTDSDDIIEAATPAEPETENHETIEKVLDHRMGKVGATGNDTTGYNILTKGDPNASGSSVDVARTSENGEVVGDSPEKKVKPEVKEEPKEEEKVKEETMKEEKVKEEKEEKVKEEEGEGKGTVKVKEGEGKVKVKELEKQYLIKWKAWAHIHNTWETVASLHRMKCNGIKKLENYIKKEEEIDEWKQTATPEDIEYYICQKEMLKDLFVSHQDVERIIACQDNAYMCKWVGLPYSECTWEDVDLITNRYPDKVDEYQARLKCPRIPNKLHKVLKFRPKFVALKTQPAHLGSEELRLRDYQLDGINWLVHAWTKHNSVILADEMGLGKTIQIVSFLAYLYNSHQLYGPFLLVVPLSTLNAWQREFQNWAPELNVVVYIGDVISRNMIREYEWTQTTNKKLKFNVLITTYEILLKDKSYLSTVDWAFLGVDEAHRLKNDDSLLYRSLQEFATNHRILVTGTPLQNVLKELWSLLHFIMPDKFDDWGDFEKKHGSQDKTSYDSLHRVLEPYLLRRVKKDVEKSLPSKVEQILRVGMTQTQKKYYKWLLTKNYKALSKGNRGNVSSFINLIMELKKCCNHAHLIRTEEEDDNQERLQLLLRGSGKLMLLDKLLLKLRASGHRVLIFSQMVRMLDIIAEYMQMRRFPYQRLDGSIRGDIRKQSMDHFNAEGSVDFCFLLSTRAGGLGVNLATADTVVIYDSDWNPQNDLQAQARAHRIGQKNQVSVYRLVTSQSVEETILERAKQKRVLEHLVIQSMDTSGRTVLSKGSAPSCNATPFGKEELSAILKFGAEELFKGSEEDGKEEEEEVDIDKILQYAETQDTDPVTGKDDFLSQFKVVNYNMMEEEDTNDVHNGPSPVDAGKDWEEIIPESIRLQVDEEERQKQLLDLHLPPRSRKTIKQLEQEYDSDRGKSKRSKDNNDDSDASNEEEDDEEDDKPKKRGRPKASVKEKVKGFADTELRRFIKSYKKFAHPLTRLDAIAIDAELQEKSEADLKHLAEVLQKNVDEAMSDYAQKIQDDPSFDGKKTHRGPTFKLSSVMVNAQAIMKAQADLEALLQIMPADREQRKKFQLTCLVKKVHWDCPWDLTDDSNLLRGIYEYGLGSWEAIKMDTELKLHTKILPDVDGKKPQAKHVQTRAEYLLKVLRKRAEINEACKPLSAAGKGKSKRKPKSKAEVIENDLSSGSEDAHSKADTNSNTAADHQRSKKAVTESAHKHKHDDSDLSDLNLDEPADNKKKSKKAKGGGKKDKSAAKKDAPKADSKKKGKKKKSDGPMHFTALSEPISIESEEKEMPMTAEQQETFRTCKEMMRPVKKPLKRLDKPREGPEVLRKYLLEIGDHIKTVLNGYSKPEDLKLWRTNLWNFVANFTDLGSDQLRKLYKKSAGKRKEEEDKDKSEPNQSDSQQSRDSTSVASKRSADKDLSVPNHQVKKPRQDGSLKKASRVKQSSRSKSGPKGVPPLPRPPPPHKEAARADHGNSGTSPTDRWQHASPLARAEEVARSRYNNFDHYSNTTPNRAASAGEGGGAGPGGGGGGGGRSHYNQRDPHYNRPPDPYGSYRPDRDGGHNREHHRPEYGHHYRDGPHPPRQNDGPPHYPRQNDGPPHYPRQNDGPPHHHHPRQNENQHHPRPNDGPHYPRHNDGPHHPRHNDGWGPQGHFTYGEHRKRRSDDGYGNQNNYRRQYKDPRLDHKDHRFEHKEHKDPRFEHKEHKDPRFEHKEHKDPRFEHKEHKDPRFEHKEHKDPRFEHKEHKDPRFEHKEHSNDPRLDHNRHATHNPPT